jgi:HPt (histidine-containing phosphotransfer) domain-containing protein
MITASTTIKGLDIPSALARMGGKEALYNRLLGIFFKGAELSALKESLGNGDISKAAGDAHTLKGTAANLSVVDIQAVAAELEYSLKNSHAVGEAHRKMLIKIEELYDDVRASCAPYFEG